MKGANSGVFLRRREFAKGDTVVVFAGERKGERDGAGDVEILVWTPFAPVAAVTDC